MNHTTLETSKLISSKVSIETEKWWIWTNKPNPQVISKVTTESDFWKDRKHLLINQFTVNAYSFTDCLRAIDEYGVKYGWGVYEQHKLLDAYIADGHSIGEECDALLVKIFV